MFSYNKDDKIIYTEGNRPVILEPSREAKKKMQNIKGSTNPKRNKTKHKAHYSEEDAQSSRSEDEYKEAEGEDYDSEEEGGDAIMEEEEVSLHDDESDDQEDDEASQESEEEVRKFSCFKNIKFLSQ